MGLEQNLGFQMLREVTHFTYEENILVLTVSCQFRFSDLIVSCHQILYSLRDSEQPVTYTLSSGSIKSAQVF
jgi:hypothetical protein